MHFRNKYLSLKYEELCIPLGISESSGHLSFCGNRLQINLKQMEIIVLIYTNTDVCGDVLYKFKTALQILLAKTLQVSFCKLYEVSSLPESLRAQHPLSALSTA